MAQDDWLATEEKVGLPAVVDLPADFASRNAIGETCWQRLTLKQKTFLQAWRECRYNARAACRQLGLSEKTRPMTAGLENPDFAMVVKIWTANGAASALDKDRLLARQDDIVETLLTPKPVLHQGIAVLDPRDVTGTKILEEVDAAAASRANEVLLDRALPKPRADVEVNVGVAFTPVRVELEEAPRSVIDATAEIVDVEPILPAAEEDWLA